MRQKGKEKTTQTKEN